MFVQKHPVLALVCLSLGFATITTASVLTYTSPAAFAAAASSLSTINFDGIAEPATIATLSSYSKSGVTFQGQTTSGPGVYIITPSYYFEYSRDGHDSIDSFRRTTPATFTITLPAGTTAVAMDLFSVTEGLSGGTDTETFNINGQNFVTTTIAHNGLNNGSDLRFFGFTSTTPISSFTITTGNTMGNTGIDIEHFQFGAAAVAAVPEPAAFLLIGGGLVVTCLLLLRRRAA